MPNAIYQNIGGTVVTFSESGGTVTWTPKNRANGEGRESNQYDQGVYGTSAAYWWAYTIFTQAQATPTLKKKLRCFIKRSDGTTVDNDTGTTDANMDDEDKLSNLLPLISPCVDQAAANVQFVSRGVIFIPERYFQIVCYNDMGSAITNDAAETKAVFRRLYDDVQ